MKRFSVRWLLGLIALCALGFAALKSATPVWVELWQSIRFLLLATAIVGAVFTRSLTRAYWTGFSVFGWLALFGGMTFAPWASYTLDVGAGHEIAMRLHPHLRTKSDVSSPGRTPVWDEATQIFLVDVDNKIGNAETISGCLFGVLQGFLGGVIARAFASRNLVTDSTRPDDRRRT
jgi:hypothetical protein